MVDESATIGDVTLPGLRRALDNLPIESEAARRLDALVGFLEARDDEPSHRLVVAVAGPSGTGKSTLINSMAGSIVSPAGPLRPTTTEATAWAAADDVPPALDALRRSVRGTIVDSVHRLVERMAIIDTPPPGADHDACVDHADVVIFVVSPLRYADARPWKSIAAAIERDAEVIPVLNRFVPERHEGVREDLERRLGEAGIAIPPIVVEERPGLVDGILDGPSVAGIRKELEALVELQGREQLRSRVLQGALAASARWTRQVAGEVAQYLDARRSIERHVEEGYGEAVAELVTQRATGGLSDLAEEQTPSEGLAAVVTHRAGRAARVTAESFVEGPMVDLIRKRPDLYGHGGDTLASSRLRLGAFWEAVPEHLAELVELRRGSRRRLASAVTVRLLDPDADLSWRQRRVLRKHADVEAAVGGRLDALLVELMAADAARFAEAFGPDVDDADRAALGLDSR